jgi:hypothetical protein
LNTPEGDAEMQDSHSDGKNGRALESVDSNGYHSFLRYSISHNHSNHWSRHATIRHSNLVQFEFRHFSLPEDRETVEAMLSSFGKSHEGILSHPDSIFMRDLNHMGMVTTTMDVIYQLQKLWTKSSPRPCPANCHPIRARIRFHTYTRPTDWQLVRRLTCITISELAAKVLMEISVGPNLVPSDHWSVHGCRCFLTEAQSLRSLSGKNSLDSAAMFLCFDLEPPDRQSLNLDLHLRWVTPSLFEDPTNPFGDTSTSSALDSVMSSLEPFWGLYKSSILEEIPPESNVSPSLARLLPEPTGKFRDGGILFKKPSYWSEICPTFCFMIYDDSSFDDEPALSEKIIRACNSGEGYGDLDGSFFDALRLPSPSDRRAIRLWADILSKNEAPDAEWPL